MLISLRISGLNISTVEVKVVEPIKFEEETITYNVDHIVPTPYTENHLFLLE